MFGSFLGQIWQVITSAKNAVGNLIFIGIIIFILVSIFSVETQTIPKSSALVIDPTGVIVEQKKVIDPVSRFLAGYTNEESETSLKDILDAIDAAKTDDRIKLIVLNLNRLQGAGLSKLEDIGAKLDQFKQSGKPVYAFGERFGQGQYYIASHADKVYLDETSFGVFGGVFLPGMGIYPTYFKSALDKFKIKFNVYRVGQFKSAVEPYLRDDMSDAAKLSNQAWLDSLWSQFRHTVTSHRPISDQSFDQYTNDYDELLASVQGDANLLAVQQGLVDNTITWQEWVQRVNDVLGVKDNDENFDNVGFRQYLSSIRPPIVALNPTAKKIAVVTASGVIYDGKRPPGEIGADSISELINQARLDDSVKALVLRVDSPGGSATAAEVIRQAVLRVKQDGKPVVVSMGTYAASGGYWISAPANKIFATETTITGSIGTFMSFPTLEDVASEYGVHADGVGTTNLSGSLNLLKHVSPRLDNLLQHSVNATYKKFIDLVAEGRGMTAEQVDTLGQGRVWAAPDALDNGLIDAIGNLNDAIHSAALLADVSDYDVYYVEPAISTKDRLINEILNNSLHKVYSLAGGFSFNQYFIPEQISQRMREFIQMSQHPGLYIQCLECKVSL